MKIRKIFCVFCIIQLIPLFVFGQSFTQVTTGIIVNDGGISYGSAWGDYDNDGDLDLFVANWHCKDNFLYSNNGDGTFTKITTGPVVTDGGWSCGGCWGDYDNDCDLDLFVFNDNDENNFLYTNNGDGTFTKVTSGIIVSDGGRARCGSWVDYDNDGDLDLFVANRTFQNNFLYTNNGDGTFAKVTSGVIVSDDGCSNGCDWGDYNNDGYLDLFVANWNQNNFLYANNGDGTFTKITTGPVVTDGGYSVGGSWGDYDNDGDLDLFVSNYNHNNYLYSNNGDETFAKVVTGSIVNDGGKSEGSSWADYDNDGDLDLFVANSGEQNNFLYSNNGDGLFTKIITGPLVTSGGESAGGSWCDYDNDGDLDIFISNDFDNNNFFYINDGNSNHWINIECIGSISNKSAIGAKIKVRANIWGEDICQMNEISAVTGKYDQNSLNVEFGLGDASLIDEIRVEWPSGIIQILRDVSPNQFIILIEALEVFIDIKPGSYPNSINLGSKGNVPVAIFSSAFFDATTVDPMTVALAGASVKIKGKGTPMASIEDVNLDGLLDIVVHVDTSALELSETDVEAVLEGETFDGIRIRGVDTVRILY